MAMATRSNATTNAVVVTAATTAAVLVVTYTYYWTQARYQKNDNKGTTTTTISPQETLDLIRRRRSIFPKHYNSDTTNGGHVVDRQVVDDMLEAATWAPSHHLTEPWHFIVFHENRQELGRFLAEQYRAKAGDGFVETKYQKKIQNCVRATFVICLLCTLSDKNPAVEDVCSVAAAVQNMHLVATANRVGAYWSTSGIYAAPQHKNKSSLSFPENKGALLLENPTALREFLNLVDNDICLGWMFVGPFEGKWPHGRRTPCRVQER
jgi:nitroreductase